MGNTMDYCKICRSRHTWDCEDERESGRTFCGDFEIDFSALSSKDKAAVQRIVMAYLLMKENE